MWGNFSGITGIALLRERKGVQLSCAFYIAPSSPYVKQRPASFEAGLYFTLDNAFQGRRYCCCVRFCCRAAPEFCYAKLTINALQGRRFCCCVRFCCRAAPEFCYAKLTINAFQGRRFCCCVRFCCRAAPEFCYAKLTTTAFHGRRKAGLRATSISV